MVLSTGRKDFFSSLFSGAEESFIFAIPGGVQSAGDLHFRTTIDPMPVNFDLRNFAERYTAAWCSQNAASVATFFAPNGSLTINDGPPSIGRAAITNAAQGFMTAFPDLRITMDDVSADGVRAIYRWTLEGTNTGPRGTGAHVLISGYEEWQFSADNLIGASLGHFDAANYQRQLARRG